MLQSTDVRGRQAVQDRFGAGGRNQHRDHVGLRRGKIHAGEMARGRGKGAHGAPIPVEVPGKRMFPRGGSRRLHRGRTRSRDFYRNGTAPTSDRKAWAAMGKMKIDRPGCGPAKIRGSVALSTHLSPCGVCVSNACGFPPVRPWSPGAGTSQCR